MSDGYPSKTGLYLVTHVHRHGDEHVIVRCSEFPTFEQIVDRCQFNFNPNKDEDITIEQVDEIVDL